MKNAKLAREQVDNQSLNYFDLEDPASLARLQDPDFAFRPLKGLVVIDEIQRRPDLFPLLRVLADLKLDELWVVHPGSRRYPLAEKVNAVPLVEFIGAA